MALGSKQNILMVFIFLIIGSCLCACSSFPFKPAEEVLQSRVQGFMDAKVKSEWGKVYEYYSPSYRENFSRDAFLGINRKSEVLKYKIESIKINPSGDEATVKVKTDMAAMTFEFPGVVMTQKWVKVGWTWYFEVNNENEKPL